MAELSELCAGSFASASEPAAHHRIAHPPGAPQAVPAAAPPPIDLRCLHRGAGFATGPDRMTRKLQPHTLRRRWSRRGSPATAPRSVRAPAR